MEPEQSKFNIGAKLQTKVWGISFKSVLTKLQKGDYGKKDGGLRQRGKLVLEVRGEDRIVSIYTRKVGGDKQSQDILAHRNLRWRGATTLMVEFWEA